MFISKPRQLLYNLIGKEYIKAIILTQNRKQYKTIALELDADYFENDNRVYLINLNDAIRFKNRYILFYDLKSIRNLERSDVDTKERIKNISFIDPKDKINGKWLYTFLSEKTLKDLVKENTMLEYIPIILSVLTLAVSIMIFITIGG